MTGTNLMVSQEDQKHSKMFFLSPREDCFDAIKKSIQEIREESGDPNASKINAIDIFSKANFCVKDKCDQGCKICDFKAFSLSKQEIKKLREIYGYNNSFIVFVPDKQGQNNVDYTL